MNEENCKKLIRIAIEVRQKSYSPYSHFQVGAALMTKAGNIYQGCNIENAAYSPTNCAERTAFFKAISEGEREFIGIAIVGSPEGEVIQKAYPCGVCRQVMMEFCNPEEFQVITAISEEDYQQIVLKELLPYGFSPSDLTANK